MSSTCGRLFSSFFSIWLQNYKNVGTLNGSGALFNKSLRKKVLKPEEKSLFLQANTFNYEE